MTRAAAFLVGCLAAGMLAVAVLGWLRHRDHLAADRAREQAITALSDTLASRSDSLVRVRREAETAESAYSIAASAYQEARTSIRLVRVADTLTLTALDTVYIAGDSLPHPIPLAVGYTLAKCDTLASKCALAMAHADSALAVQGRQILTLETLRDSLLRRPGPPRFGFRTGAVVGAIAALIAHALLR